MSTNVIAINGLNYEATGNHICKDMDLEIEKGLFYGIIGPNGSGKTTLMKQICRVLIPSSGTIYLNGRELGSIPYRESAQALGVLMQENELSFDFTVEEMVMMGRSPYHDLLQKETDEDRRIVRECIDKVNMTDFVDRSFVTLSGGEKQRVLLARALAQNTDTLLLDEPTNNLDIGHQYKMFELLKSLPLTIFMIVHDMNLAAHFCDRIVIIEDGRITTVGTPEQVLTSEMLYRAFNVNAEVTIEENGRPYIKYLSSTGAFD